MSGEYRCAGQWVDSHDISIVEAKKLESLGRTLKALPGWPLAEGLDLSAFRPDPHQLLVADLLATDWLSYAGLASLSELGH